MVASYGKCLINPPKNAAGHFPQAEIQMEQLQTLDALKIPVGEKEEYASVFVLQYKENGGPFNGGHYERLPISDGFVDIAEDPQLCRMCACNRYGSGEKTVALMRGSGLTCGAYAFTVSHDSHNPMIVYQNETDALFAAERVREMGGGYAAVCDGKILADLPLPVGGIMSDQPVLKLAEEIKAFENASAQLFSFPGNLLRFATCSLSVLPGYVLTDRGIVDGKQQKFVDGQK